MEEGFSDFLNDINHSCITRPIEGVNIRMSSSTLACYVFNLKAINFNVSFIIVNIGWINFSSIQSNSGGDSLKYRPWFIE